jgi:tRNA (cytidine/uridine-2'-O-)-methyltransferase
MHPLGRRSDRAAGEAIDDPAVLAKQERALHGSAMRLALYEPDIPQNAGAILRLGACLGVGIDIIEPCGFLLEDRRLRRAGLDYAAQAALARHASWEDFLAARPPGRLLLLTTQGDAAYHRFAYRPDDTLLLGRETAGAPPAVHRAADARIRVPLRPGLRSLNVAIAAALVLGEALRQTGLLPEMEGAG